MSNPNRLIDKTYLSLDLAEERGLVHRDYLAHCTRWSHVVKHLNKGHAYKDAVVLDVGCGKELPLAKLMYVNKMSPALYVGVDANKFGLPEMLAGKKIPTRLWSEADFCALDPEDVSLSTGKLLTETNLAFGTTCRDKEGIVYRKPNVVACFEVLEHVTPEHCRRMLQHFQRVASSEADFFFSTPCYNGSAAGNHINEMTFGALGALLEDLNYKIEGVYGTFASISDYESELDAVTTIDKHGKTIVTNLRPIFNVLRGYYDTNVLSILFAPLFPAGSRNCLWHCRWAGEEAASQTRMFSTLSTVPGPWSQHPDWKQLDAAAEVVKQ